MASELQTQVIAPQGLEIDTLSDDDLVRRSARLKAQLDVLQTESQVATARSNREAAQLEAQIKILELRAQVANNGRKPSDGPAPGTAAATAAVAAVQAPQPVVRSIYGYGSNGYAEIYIGYDKVLATPGTVLSTGHRVVEIGPSGVVVVRNGRRQTLGVRGAAGVVPVSASVPMGLPPAPPSN